MRCKLFNLYEMLTIAKKNKDAKTFNQIRNEMITVLQNHLTHNPHYTGPERTTIFLSRASEQFQVETDLIEILDELRMIKPKKKYIKTPLCKKYFKEMKMKF